MDDRKGGDARFHVDSFHSRGPERDILDRPTGRRVVQAYPSVVEGIDPEWVCAALNAADKREKEGV